MRLITKSNLQTLFIMIYCFSFFSCSKNYEYNSIIEDYDENQIDFVKEKKIGEVTFSGIYLPKNYLALKEYCSINKDCKELIDSEKYNQTLNELGNLNYFRITISTNNENKELLNEAINSKLKYFVSNAKNDLALKVENDTFPVKLYNFDFYPNIGNKAVIDLAFESKSIENKSVQLLFNAFEIEAGLIKFKFENLKN